MITPKSTYISKKLVEHFFSPGTGKNVADAVQAERERARRKHAELVPFFAKIAFALPKPGAVMGAKHVGSFPGKATQNFLKPPGSTTASVTNPRLGLRNAMTKSMRV